MSPQIELDRIRQVMADHQAWLMKKRNVVGVGIGFKEKAGQSTDQMALVVSVSQKLPEHEIDSADRIPTEIEGVPVDVKEVGEIRALS
jgi:hypothetical protein